MERVRGENKKERGEEIMVGRKLARDITKEDALLVKGFAEVPRMEKMIEEIILAGLHKDLDAISGSYEWQERERDNALVLIKDGERVVCEVKWAVGVVKPHTRFVKVKVLDYGVCADYIYELALKLQNVAYYGQREFEEQWY